MFDSRISSQRRPDPEPDPNTYVMRLKRGAEAPDLWLSEMSQIEGIVVENLGVAGHQSPIIRFTAATPEALQLVHDQFAERYHIEPLAGFKTNLG